MNLIPVNCDCILANGDSWVFGAELRDPSRPADESDFEPIHMDYRVKHSWPTLVGQALGFPVINASEGGAGNDRILRTTVFEVSKLLAEGRKPFVLVAWSQLQRFELPGGPNGQFYRSFVSPADANNPPIANEIWGNWSSDRTDLTKWLQSVILLDSFLKTNQVGYFGLSVFKEPYRIFEDLSTTQHFQPYMSQLGKVDLTRHLYHFSLESILRQYTTDIKYGPGGHPLELGHERLAEYIEIQIGNRFIFNTGT